jgi:hypothetical protein
VAVHRTTGDVYVLIPRENRLDRKRFKTSRLVKFGPDGERKSVFEFPGGCVGRSWRTGMALDDSADPPIIWLSRAGQKDPKYTRGLWRVADRGDRFEKLGDLIKGGGLPVSAPYNAFITVDPEERYLYVKTVAKRLEARHVARWDMRTGERDRSWKVPVMVQPVDEVFMGPDGLLYVRGCTLDRFDGGKKDEHIWRMDPDTGAEVPFPAAPNGRITFPGPFTGGWQRSGFCVAPNGDVYVLVDGRAAGTRDVSLYRFGSGGVLIDKDLIPGYPPTSSSIRVDRAGCIVASIHYPVGKAPEFLDGLVENYRPSGGRSTGALYKFPPQGGSYRKPGDGGYLARYVGIAPFAATYSSFDGFSNRHDLDGFDRVFFPIAHMGTILVLDANLNRIVRIGNYGNVDNNGPESAYPDPEIGLFSPQFLWAGDRSLYIADLGNSRLLRADLTYEVEEEVAVR